MTENKGNKRKRETELTQYTADPITRYSRSHLAETYHWIRQLKLLKTIPNYHSKYPDVKAQLPMWPWIIYVYLNAMEMAKFAPFWDFLTKSFKTSL